MTLKYSFLTGRCSKHRDLKGARAAGGGRQTTVGTPDGCESSISWNPKRPRQKTCNGLKKKLSAEGGKKLKPGSLEYVKGKEDRTSQRKTRHTRRRAGGSGEPKEPRGEVKKNGADPRGVFEYKITGVGGRKKRDSNSAPTCA